jgi:hypothetical protein
MKNATLNQSKAEKKLMIFDNGGKTLDRYTILIKNTIGRNGLHDAIAASENGLGVYLHIEALKGSHLGKRIKFKSLSTQLQNMLLSELS